MPGSPRVWVVVGCTFAVFLTDLVDGHEPYKSFNVIIPSQTCQGTSGCNSNSQSEKRVTGKAKSDRVRHLLQGEKNE
jgi:hypothetical protein